MFKKILILATLFVLIKSDCMPDETELRTTGKIRNFDDCDARTSTLELEEMESYRCCHLFYIEDLNNVYSEVDRCILVTKAEYDDIKRFVENLESTNRLEKAKIHCASSYIRFSLILILLILSSLL